MNQVSPQASEEIGKLGRQAAQQHGSRGGWVGKWRSEAERPRGGTEIRGYICTAVTVPRAGFSSQHITSTPEQRTMSGPVEIKTLAEYDTAVRSGKTCAFFWAAWHEPSKPGGQMDEVRGGDIPFTN